MNREYLMVDGYNIINAWPLLKEIFMDNIQLARDKLVEIMAEYQAYKGIQVIIVFDGHFVKGNTGSELNVNGVQVIFTKEQETADSYIERKVKIMSRDALVKVATSDWAEQQVVMAMGGIRISASELYMLVKSANRDINIKYLSKKTASINTLDNRLPPDVIERFKEWRKL